MSDSLLKSPGQLKYELNNTQNELASLLNNWKKKKAESLGQMLAFRTELKEIDAVMAAREVSYTSYCALAKPLLNLVKPDNLLIQAKINQLEGVLPALTPWLTTIQQVIEVTHAAEEAETKRIISVRAQHKSQSEYIQRKSKEIYGAMGEEKKSVDTYAALLQVKIQGLEEQYALQTKAAGLGITV